MRGTRAQAAFLADRRLHLQDGPIDLIIEAFGDRDEIEAAYGAALRRFETILDELCVELPSLREQVRTEVPRFAGSVAQRMFKAVLPYAATNFITPMAAVAGAVADEVLQAMTSVAQLDRAYVNDGGDIAIQLAPGNEFSIGMIDRPDRPSLFGKFTIKSEDPVRGIATSGWRGRSFSLGIADAVTVLAQSAAAADAAATIIANAVDLPGHASIERVPARALTPDSDLKDRLVTQDVGPLPPAEITRALDAGASTAQEILDRGLISAVALHLQGETRILGILPDMLSPAPAKRETLIHA